MVLPHIAQEILDIIVDHFHDDRDVFHACSLASKSLLDSSYYHLFNSIEVKIVDERAHTTITRHLRWDEFLTFVTSHPRSARYIRRLCIDMVDAPDLRDYDPMSYKKFPALLLRDLVDVINYLPSLDHLYLYHLHLTTDIVYELQHTDVVCEPEKATHILRSLALCWCAFDDMSLALPETLRVIKSSKVTLHHIRCTVLASRNNPFGGPSSYSPSPLPHPDILPKYPLHIESLQVISACRLFHYSRDDDELFSVIPGLMSQVYSSLRELTLIVWQLESTCEFIQTATQVFGLQNTCRLRSVVVSCMCMYYLHPNEFASTRKDWEAHAVFLSSLPLSTEYIRVDSLPIMSSEEARPVYASLPDARILQPILLRLPALRSFTFRWGLTGQWISPESIKILSDRVSLLSPAKAQNRILRCEVYPLWDIYQSTGVKIDLDSFLNNIRGLCFAT